MRVVMYHYVRRPTPELPNFRYLHVDDFTAQLDVLGSEHRFVGREELFEAVSEGRAPDGVLLTFDDGFLEHFECVAPLLCERGLWGIFYVPSAILETPRLLDVHRIHVLLGTLGGRGAMERLTPLVDRSMLTDIDVEAFRILTYRQQTNDEETTLFKRCLNYYISYEHRGRILDQLMADTFGDEAAYARSFYMNAEHLRAMEALGMEVGSHGHQHLVFSKLDEAEQAREIARSFSLLGNVVERPIRTFCYPYGGAHTYTSVTERLLAEAGSALSFDVAPRDVSDADVAQRPHALPRFDCNQLPHGLASYGPHRTRQL